MNARVAGVITRGVIALVLALGLSIASIRPGIAAMDFGKAVRFDIAPQQLPSALLKFSAQSGVQVTSPGQLVEGKKSPGVVGTFIPGKALALLLKDTSLHFDVVDGSTVVITASANSTLSRTDIQKISNSGNASLQISGSQKVRLAQAAATDPSQSQIAQNSNSTRNASSSGKGAVKSGAELEEVIVTGSSIKRINAETALPVRILKREDIARTGATSSEDLFRQISAASSAGTTVVAQENGFGTGAISTISLRGLTSARTLILINGRRSAPYGGASTGTAGNSVDISAIPLPAIERVEILKDGASAVYGSDAIAGVVNFILRKDYQGAEITAGDGSPTHGGSGGNDAHVSAYAGLGDLAKDRYNVALGFDFERSSAILGADRPYAVRYSPGYGNDVTSGFAFPANVAIPKIGTRNARTGNPLVPDCGPYSLADANFPTSCRFDNSPFDSLEPKLQKIHVNLNGHFAVTDTADLYNETSYSQVKTTTTTQPVPLSYQNPLLAGNPYNAFLAKLLATQYPTYVNPAVVPGTGAFLLPPSSPYYPTAFAAANGLAGQPLNLIYRDFANGLRSTEDTADTLRVVGGFKGNSGGWDYDTSLLYNEVKVTENLRSGYPLYSQIMPLLDSGNINPFGPTTDPTALAAAKAAEFTGQDFATKTSITSVSAKGSRDLYTLPGGPLSVAMGAEVRRETFDFNPAAAVRAGDVAGQGGNQLPESAKRNVESAFLEFNADLVKGLEADAAVRYDNYQGVGNTVNPKGSLRWQPDHWVLVRASAGTGFRAPSLTDLYAAQVTSVTANGTRDPIQCPPGTVVANNPACSFQFTTVTGGNPHLTPEKSDSFTLGLVLEPVRDLTVGVDAFWIYLKNAITVGGLNYATILQSAQTATQFASFITRDANGQITAISQTNANLFKVALSGLDVDLRYVFNVTDTDRITLLGDGTYFNRFVSQNPDGSWTGQLDKGVTSISNGGVIARWRYNATVAYDAPSWSLSLTQNFQKRYHDLPSTTTLVPRYVSAYQTFDVQGSYVGLKSFKFTLGAKNIFNRNPPYANYAASTNNFIGGYDITYGDPRGSFVYGSVTYTVH